MSTVDMLVETTLNTTMPFSVAWNHVSAYEPLSEEVKEFYERVFKCDCCEHWYPIVEENLMVDCVFCDFCIIEGIHRMIRRKYHGIQNKRKSSS